MLTITLTLPKADSADVGIWRAALQEAHDIIMSETAGRSYDEDDEDQNVRVLAEALRQARNTLVCGACINRGWLLMVDGFASNEDDLRVERCDLCQASYDNTLFEHDDAWAIEQATKWLREHGYHIERKHKQYGLIRNFDGQLISLWPTPGRALAAGIQLTDKEE